MPISYSFTFYIYLAAYISYTICDICWFPISATSFYYSTSVCATVYYFTIAGGYSIIFISVSSTWFGC